MMRRLVTPGIVAALKDLQALCAFYKVLGTYPIGD